jgi:hypothetical protein
MSFERPFTNLGGARPAELAFNRHELSMILNVYGRMVAAGEWRDYAIDHRRDRAVFSIFRGSSEQPIYRVEKARVDGRQPGYSVVCGAQTDTAGRLIPGCVERDSSAISSLPDLIRQSSPPVQRRRLDARVKHGHDMGRGQCKRV